PGPEEPEQAPPLPVYVSYVPEPAYPEFMPLEDEVLLAEEQPLHTALSPIADSPSYVPELDPEEDPEEDDDEDPEEDPADYPANRGDNGDDEDESSNDDENDDVDTKEEEEEHLAPADSTAVALPAVDHAPSAEETDPFETGESAATPPLHPAYQVTARISIRDEPPTTFWSDTKVSRILAIPTPPPSPLSSWYKVGESSSAAAARPTRGFRADYGFVATMDREIRRDLEIDVEFATRVRQDTNEIYVRLDDEQTEGQLMAGRLNMLYRDRRTHDRTTLLMEREAMMSREAWGRSMDASDLARSEVMSLCTTVLGQQAVITELQAVDRRSQAATR
ncbi:hypothetical protein Tco_1545173, partial [Tanacetum coccineum]